GKAKPARAPDPPPPPSLRPLVIRLQILKPHRRWRCTREVVEDVSRRFLRIAFEVIALIEAIERRFDDPGILAGLNLLLEPIALLSAGNVDKRRHPVEGREQLFLDCTRLDAPGPTANRRRPVAALPPLTSF